MAETVITGRTRGGAEWVPQFVTALNAQTCIGCGRCYKVCPRDVFTLVERGEMVDDDDDFDDDDEMSVMSIKDELDCIGCMSCARVCPKKCHSHAALAG
ncbi:ferredoxin III, nif-specific [Billgrantia endophytica]|uniref:Ferredoxin III n=1 Tax=Billgrantia endophytica TaxID=2033802 RepID=A0A2N7U0G6_9GAMM|nr:ferredoxin III, nif-specific [Halomonas endophytica]PMR73928.1 ferredoxin III, nif-specific [Halomonas endophytica]